MKISMIRHKEDFALVHEYVASCFIFICTVSVSHVNSCGTFILVSYLYSKKVMLLSICIFFLNSELILAST